MDPGLVRRDEMMARHLWLWISRPDEVGLGERVPVGRMIRDITRRTGRNRPDDTPGEHAVALAPSSNPAGSDDSE